jgi:biotin carboxyl carrier protein/GAF domain-containing protein
MYQSQDRNSNKDSDRAALEINELIERLKQTNINPAQFLEDFLASQCLLGLAEVGAILRANKENGIDVLALYPHLKKGASSPEWLKNSVGIAHEAFESGQVVVKALNGSSRSGHIVIVPIDISGVSKAVAALVISANGKTALETNSQKLRLLTAMFSRLWQEPDQKNWQENCKRLQQAMETLSAINQHNRFKSAVMAFCNEMASQWQCERASIGFLKGRYVRLEGMSHTEHFVRKMKIVQDIEATMEECLDQDCEILFPASQEATYISRAAAELSGQYGPLSILSVPIRQDEQVCAVLTLERSADKPFTIEEVEVIRLACELCTARLVSLFENDKWIGARAAAKTRSILAAAVGPEHTWKKVLAVAVLGAIIFLVFARGQYRAKASFIFEATYQQTIPAPFDGYIKNIEVEIGDMVEGGKSILGGLDTAELRLQLAAAKAEKAGYLKQVSAAMRDNETAQAQIAQADADKTQAQIELLEYKIRQAGLISPIGGIVVKGDLKRQIGAPVKTGDVLFEIAPLESLRAQLLVPEDEIVDIKIGQEGYLATVSFPAQKIKFVVEQINPMAEVINNRNVFKVRAHLLQTRQWMRPGMEGVAKVSVGKRRYIWIWTRRVINWIRMKLWL